MRGMLFDVIFSSAMTIVEIFWIIQLRMHGFITMKEGTKVYGLQATAVVFLLGAVCLFSWVVLVKKILTSSRP